MNYIDRDKLIERIVNTPSECCKLPHTIPFLNGSAARQNEIIELIEVEPAADVRENVHGEWILEDETNAYELLKCSVCGHGIFDSKYDYCPFCGADMRGEKDV